jgi:uncharacterized membrane protein
MTTPQLISLVLMSALYLLAGISHFIQPRFFLKITPKWVPYPELTNFVVGAVEVLLVSSVPLRRWVLSYYCWRFFRQMFIISKKPEEKGSM